MQESTNIENIVHHKMQDFEMQPLESDWEAIYERLHKKKRRRIIFWWWLPLAGALLLGGGYLLTRNGNPAGEQTGIITSITSKGRGNEAEKAASGTSNGLNTGSSTGKGTSETAPAPALQERALAEPQKTPINTAKKRNKLSKTPIVMEEPAEMTEISSEPTESKRMLAMIESERERTMPEVEKHIVAASPLKTATPAAEEKKAIPNLATHKENGWYLGLYGGTAINNPTSPLSMGKVMNDALANMPGTSTYTQSTSYMRMGFHYEAGAVIQKKFKKWEISFGAGMQRNGWTQGYNVYRDSIMPSGVLFSRADVASRETRYEQAAVEIPLMAGLRLSQKRANSLWLQAGLNNSFTIYVKELESATTGSLSGGSITDPLTSPINKYHPMLRLGLAYNHDGTKSHWQLSPIAQYSMNSVIQSGSPDIRMLHLGLHFRYFFLKLSK